MTPDAELLRLYSQKGSEAAFAEVVRRHMHLVYASAARLLNGNTALAEDVTQTVFTDLARKAGSLKWEGSVVGWLYASVRFAVNNAVRGEQRRREHEHEAATMNEQMTPDETTWAQMRPLIDEALNRLHEPERDAVLLRYFEAMSHREVGDALGVSEGAAQMRVERAMEKLRDYFTRKGVATTGALLAAAFGAHAALAPMSATFGATLAGKSIAAAGVKSVAVSTVTSGGWKSSLVAKAAVALAGAGALATTAAVVHSNRKPASALEAPVASVASISPTVPARAKAPVAPGRGSSAVDTAGVSLAATAAASLAATPPAAAVATQVVSTASQTLAQGASQTLPALEQSPLAEIASFNPTLPGSEGSKADTLAVDPSNAGSASGGTVNPTGAPVEESPLHEFTNLRGQKIKAQIIGANSNEVMIKRDDGAPFKIARNTLSNSDQAYIDQWLAAGELASKESPTRVVATQQENSGGNTGSSDYYGPYYASKGNSYQYGIGGGSGGGLMVGGGNSPSVAGKTPTQNGFPVGASSGMVNTSSTSMPTFANTKITSSPNLGNVQDKLPSGTTANGSLSAPPPKDGTTFGDVPFSNGLGTDFKEFGDSSTMIITNDGIINPPKTGMIVIDPVTNEVYKVYPGGRRERYSGFIIIDPVTEEVYTVNQDGGKVPYKGFINTRRSGFPEFPYDKVPAFTNQGVINPPKTGIVVLDPTTGKAFTQYPAGKTVPFNGFKPTPTPKATVNQAITQNTTTMQVGALK